MPYTTRCIKEALRIHSPVPTVGREVDKEFEIDGVRMPVGSRIQVHIHALHHNQEIWGADHEVNETTYTLIPCIENQLHRELQGNENNAWT